MVGTCDCDEPALRPRPPPPPPKRFRVRSTRHLDYLYDSAYLVSGARDYARTSFKAAMGSAQLIIQPVYRTMFSELRKFPRYRVVYHPNCRLPDHMDTSYGGYLNKVNYATHCAIPQPNGREQYKFVAVPKEVLLLKTTSPDFHPPTPLMSTVPTKPRNRGTQSVYRESSAQTIPWQPPAKASETCEKTPEVLYLDKLEWGPGKPYRTGDLPADFHTTEIINKMRHCRIWYELAEAGKFPRWMKKRDDIIKDVESKDWIFRETEIDELQDIRLCLLHKLQNEKRLQQTSKTSNKLAQRWSKNKKEMERKINLIRRSRDREIRKLEALHNGGGRLGMVQRLRAARAMGSMTVAASDPTSDLYAPVARHGYQARSRHAVISYDPSLLLLEDHAALAEPPAWLEQCSQDLKRTFSGHHLPQDPMQICERESKWSEDFLMKLHNDLKMARVGAAAMTAGPLHVLKPRRLQDTPRPATAEVEAVPETEEAQHQSALMFQRIIRGRAVQCLMYEGRTRAAELTEELKMTHGLQKEDKIRIAREEAKARDYNAIRTEAEKKEDAVTALVDELCGGAVSAALDFLEKELRRLKEERKQHAFIMIALREKQMREAAEAGRRQKEEHRRREHDEMFKQVLGVTQDTVDSYLESIIMEGVAITAKEEAVRQALKQADKVDVDNQVIDNLPPAEQHEIIAELVQQFLLPAAHKEAAKHHIQQFQRAKLDAARLSIFGLLDEGTIKEPYCIHCGTPLDELCRCTKCSLEQEPKETKHRHDWRWKATRTRPHPKIKTKGERYPPKHEFRCMLNTLLDEVVVESRRGAVERDSVRIEYLDLLKEELEKKLECRDLVSTVVDIATGALKLPVKEQSYHHFSFLMRRDALGRTVPKATKPCPAELPSAIRYQAEVKAAQEDGTCRCKETDASKKKIGVMFSKGHIIDPDNASVKRKLIPLPSELRALEELRRCKCDQPSTIKERSLSYTSDTSGMPRWTSSDDSTELFPESFAPKTKPDAEPDDK